MLNNPQQRKALVLSLLMVMLAQTAYIGAMQGWSYPTELDEPSPLRRSPALENLFPDLDLRLFVDPSNSSSYSGTGTNLVDLSSYDHNGTIDGATWEAERTRFAYDGSCAVGAVANFDCDEINFAETNDHDPDSGGDWSVSTWFNASTIQQSVIVGKLDDGGAAGDVGWMIRMNTDGVRVDVGTTTNSSAAWTPPESVATDRWYHVVMVADKGTSLAMFIDGAEVKNISLASSGDLRNTANGVSIGSYNAGEYSQPFDGQIGAVMAYADALNLTAVNQLYNASKGVYSNSTALSYSPENMTLEKGTTMTTNTPSVSGGAVTSWEISPSLPSGLAFSTSTGAISGTPTILQTTAATYTIWANNSGGSASAQVNITINDEAPDISYNPDWFVLTNNTAMQAVTPTNSGGAIPSAFFGYTGDAKATSIAVDSYGHKHVSYRGVSGYLMYATDTSGSWDTVTVDSVAAGWDGINSIAIDFNDVLHISYFVGSSADLKYATCSSACTTASNWNNVSVDTTGSVGHYSAIAIDSNGALHISYEDDTNKDLKYATCSNGCTTASNWNKVSVDTTGGVGYYTSIALDSNDALHISYFDGTNINLKYATCSSSCTTASNWNTVSVDSFGSLVLHPEIRTDLAIDSNDGVHLSYFDNTNDDLKYATCSSGCTTASNWNKVSVDTTGDVGYSASIGIDSNDGLHISYSDKTNNNLNYATCSNACTTASNWNNETVDSSSVLTGEYTSIAIDANDFIHISYFDDTTNKIRHLALDSSSNILGYSVSPDLPTGLRLDTMIGKISGTPTELSTNTTYTITVRNSGGVNTTTITILVNDQVPNALGYTPENMTLEKGTTMTTNTPSVSGGAVTSWEIDPSLPSGLAFSTSTGAISGTPTILQTTAATYTIWANNSGGSESAQVNITINDATPGPFEYNPENNTLTNNTYVNLEPDFINITTGNGSSWSMPAGTFHPFADSSGTPCLSHIHNGTLYASATNGTGTTTYLYGYGLSNATAWVVNSTVTGPGCIYVGLGMAGGAFGKTPDMVYGTSLYFEASEGSWQGIFGFGLENNTLWKVTAAEPTNSFFVAMDDVIYFGEYHNSSIGYELHAVNVSNGTKWLVEDINSGSGNGMYSGAPPPVVLGDEFVFNAYDNSVWGTYVHNTSNGSTWRITTEEMYTGQAGVLGDVVYSMEDLSVGNGNKLNAYNASNNTHWQVHDIVSECSPSVINMDDIMYYCANSGVSVTSSNTANNALWAHNPSNGSTWMIGGSEARIQGEYVEANGRLFYRVYGNELWTYEPSNGTAWKVTDASPNGESFTSLGNTVYFTSETDPISAEHNLWAYNTANESTWFVTNISASNWGWTSSGGIQHPEVTSLIFAGDTIYIREGGGMRSHQPASINYQTNTGGAVTSWAINASLPSGLTFSTTNGSIYGTPTELWTQTAYMVWANNSGGSSVAYLNITVVDELPIIAYSPFDITLTNNTASTDLPLIPTITGPGEVTSWAINASLPAGLTFETSNGTIWGTPTELWTTTTYTVWANNSGGSTVAYLNITVIDQVPTITYNPSNLNLTNNTTSTDLPLVPTVTGPGEITTWAINASLPSGVSFGTNNGTIYGTPTELWPQTSYMVWANNSGGSSAAYLNITVVDELPTLSYNPSGQNIPLDTTMTTMSPVLTGAGDITSWELSAALPQGVTFNTSTGVISGTPTEVWTNTTYTVWANNSGGSTNATVWLKVSVLAPNISYNVTNVTLIVNASSVSYVATNTGGNISNGGDGIAGFSDAFCSLTENGTVVCWGQNEHGRINASASTFDSLEPTIVPMPSGRFATGVAVGAEVACALLDNSSVVCWGDSNESRILSHWADDGIITPRFIPGLSGSASVTQLQVSYDTACVLLSDGDMKCWGLGAWGNLGQGNTTSLALPTSVSILPSSRSVVQIAVGAFHTCALLDNNSLMCFGDNDYYQLGDGTTTYRPFGVYADLGTRTISTVGAGWLGTCVAYHEGGASCWGRNDYGMVGDGTTTTRSTPVNVTGLGANTTFASVHTLFGETCGIATNGSLLCWGDNNGFQAAASYTPGIVDVGTNVSIVSVALDTDTACALLSTGEIQCWGYSGVDENFGLNSTSSSSTPVRGVTNETHRTINGGWNIFGVLPQGLQFSVENGTIWGTPVVVQPQWTNYTVKVYNSAGSSTYTFSIRVIDALPNVTYAPSYLMLTNNTVSSDLPLVPTLTGAGEISSWAINASLPAGLTFGTNNGTIWGTPTELWTQTSYMVWANNTGGSSLAYLNITVNDQLPTNLTYTPENLTLVRGEVSSDLPLVPTLTGPGDITSWAINASLPSGLSFGTNNGTIWGVPSVNMTTTTYTVWANNSGGSVSTSINITVLEPAVGLEYNPENITLIRGVQMATLSPTLTGGLASSWNITPALPSGLLFIDGVISGTPTVNMTATMYTVWANNTGGDVSHTINITILEPSGNLSYSPENITLTRGVTMSPLHPTYSGGAVENWSIHPALPAGLNFSNGVISGTPTVNMTTTMFTLYANNTGGSAAATINITILEPVVDLLYSPNNLTLMRGTTMPPLHPIVSGGNVSEWALVGVLPEGLNFSNGVFSGTPLVNMTQTQYLVYANTTGGSAIAWINITVLEPAVNLSYNPYNLTLTRNVTMNPLTPIVSGGNVSNWSIFPELPAGLDFTNGTISGTSEVNLTTTMFTVWANTSGGATSTTVNITVLEPVVDFLYSPNAIVLMRNETMNVTSPVFGDDAMAEEWGISPALPEGLNFSNGTISGTPLVNLTATVFTIYANNSGGSVVAFLTITVLEPVATVVYVPENITLTRGEDNASLVPLLAGGMVASWSISPDLPEGLVFDNGSITGVPLVNMTNTTFTVMALNSGGMAFAFLNITVVEPVAVLAFNESFLGTRGETLFNATVENTGGTVATWAIEPALPSGVSFTNGRLFGVAQANLSETVFTLWANNSGGSVNLTFTLVVLEPVANISYPVDDMTLIRGSSRSNLRPLVEGGVPETWEIEPALPEGLRLVNGFVIGVPLGLIDETTFTVWANNSGGSASATFTLTVNQPTYLARYPVTRVVLEVNETMAPVFPIYYFGSAQQPDWAISPELPEGLVFFDGRISGTPTVASNETNYTVTVTGDMVPVELFIIIEVRGEPDLVVENIRNATEEEVFSLPDLTPEDDSFDMYWACFPLLLLVTLMGVAAINNFLALTAKDEEDEDEEGPENEGKSSD